jgi:Fe-Mn family superoxide dismutase
MNRRDQIKLISAAAVAAPFVSMTGRSVFAQAPATPTPPAGPFKQPPLPFLEPQLAPTISNRTVTLHYGRHHAGYYANLNNLTKDTKFASMNLAEVIIEANKETDRRIFNNAGQAWNHELYWEQFKPGGAKAPAGKLAEMISASFGSLDQMKAKLKADTTAVFGSGWGWLAQTGDKLAVVTTAGGDNPITKEMTPLLGIDVWEHAYYLDYENRRPDHIQAVLDNIVNWDVVANRLKA